MTGRAPILLLLGAFCATTGCMKSSSPSGSGGGTPIPPATGALGISGSVGNGGGRQPLAGAIVQIYEVGTSADGSAAKPMLKAPAVADSAGFFTVQDAVQCDSPAALVYVTATGSYAGLPSTANPNVAYMTAVGRCDSLTTSTFVFLSALSTAASVSALAPFLSGVSSMGSSPANAQALQQGFALASAFYNSSNGFIPGKQVPAGDVVPVSLLDTLANIVNACANSSGGAAGDGTSCGQLFSLTTPPGGTAPTNTVNALLNLLSSPGANVSGLIDLAPPSAPFQPSLTTVPESFSVQISEPGTLQTSPSTGLAFGLQAVGGSSAPKSLTVKNGGTAAVAISGVTLAGVNAAEFRSSNDCSSGLMPGQSCTIMVQFGPSATKYRNAWLLITTGSSGFVQTVPVTGVGQ